jgi:hypothetical protein
MAHESLFVCVHTLLTSLFTIQIKKGYMKIIRLIHPDKMAGESSSNCIPSAALLFAHVPDVVVVLKQLMA